MPNRQNRDRFECARFILTEGIEDAATMRALIKARNLGEFAVSPNDDIGSVRGNSGFGKAVIACEVITGFDLVSDVVVVADNDERPADSFSEVRRQIEDARRAGLITRNWGAAVHPATKAHGDPSVSVWMWPREGESGCLETILWEVIQAAHPAEAACALAACNCSGAIAWPASKRDKALVRSFISIACRNDPGLTLGKLWRDRPDLIPLDHSAFDPVCEFLAAI